MSWSWGIFLKEVELLYFVMFMFGLYVMLKRFVDGRCWLGRDYEEVLWKLYLIMIVILLLYYS